MNQQPPNLGYVVANAVASTNPFVEEFMTRDPTPDDTQYPIQKRWFNTIDNIEWILVGFTSMGGLLQAIWEPVSGTGAVLSITTPTGDVFPDPSTHEITFNSPGSSVTITGSGSTVSFTTQTGTSPVEFVAGDDAMSVQPVANIINFNGETVANGTNAKPVAFIAQSTTLEGLDVQLTAGVLSSNVNNAGLSSFNQSQFNVDANGFVQLQGSSGSAVQSITVGVTSVIPNMSTGEITFTSADSSVLFTPSTNTIDFSAPGSGGSGIQHIITDTGAGTPLQGTTINLNSAPPFATATGPNAMSVTASTNTQGNIALQLAGSNASTSTPDNFGIAQFDANQFNVTSGFVQLAGGTTPAIQKINVQTGTSPIVPSSSTIVINGALVAAGTNPVRSDGTSGNTLAIEVQTSQALASADSTKVGLSNFSSSEFSVAATGFVTSNNFSVNAGAGLTGGGSLTLGGSTTLSIPNFTDVTSYTPIVNTINNDMTGQSYSLQRGYYMRIGNLVFVTGTAVGTASSAGTGDIRISLPITVINVPNGFIRGPCTLQSIPFPTNTIWIVTAPDVNSTWARFTASLNNFGSVNVATHGTFNIEFSVTYFA
jgi:hypothetical protein